MGYIYKVTNKINGKIYIGLTKNSVEYRFNQHFRELKYENKYNLSKSYFHNALDKYGKENFQLEILEEVDDKLLVDREIFWIDKLNSTDKSIGYNLSNGGETPTMTNELRLKLSKIQRERLKDPNIRDRSMLGLRKATRKWSKISKENRTVKFCKMCNNKFEVTKSTSSQMYCSRECKDKDYQSWFDFEKVKENARLGNISRSENSKLIRDKIKDYTYQWTLENVEYVDSIKFNDITPKLQPLLDEIESEYEIKDLRTVAQAVCNSNSKKLLLSNLKDYIKMYAEPDQN